MLIQPKPRFTPYSFKSLLAPLGQQAGMLYGKAPLVCYPFQTPLFGIKGVVNFNNHSLHFVLEGTPDNDPRDQWLKTWLGRYDEFKDHLFEGEMDLEKALMFATRGDEAALYHAKRMLNGDGPDSDAKRFWKVLEAAMLAQKQNGPLGVYLLCSDGHQAAYAFVPSLSNRHDQVLTQEEWSEAFLEGRFYDYEKFLNGEFYVLKPEE